MYVKKELKSYKLSASQSGFFCRVCFSISEMNSGAEQPNLEMLGGFNFESPGTALTPRLDPAWLLKALVMLHYQFKNCQL